MNGLNSAVTEADVARIADQRSAATWTLACGARDAADFAELCEAAGLDTDRRSLAAVRAVHGPSRRRRPGKARSKGRMPR